MPRATSGKSTHPDVKTVNPDQVAARLRELAMNLRWIWEPTARDLLAGLDPARFHAERQNPIALLADLPAHRLEELARDTDWLHRLADCEKNLADYLKSENKAWFHRTARGRQKRMRVGYFSAEFALHESLPIYSGGLGVLAGDHLKSASDLGVPLVAVGLLYRHGYYRQRIEPDGATRADYPPHDFDRLPVTDTGHTVTIPMARGKVVARLWRVSVGRIPLILLDTDHADNTPAQRAITHHLYGGDSEMRIRQEILLGVGGKLALDALDLTPTVYHLNEGHAAFASLQRLVERIADGQSLEQAREAVRASTVFTTHTPVPAGHDRFEPKLAMKYLAPIVRPAALDKPTVLDLGSEDDNANNPPFCMTALALKTADHCNGVAELHGEVSREMWAKLYGVQPDEVPIGHVTNGVHLPTWLAPEARPLLAKRIKLDDWQTADAFADPWTRASRIGHAELWELRNVLRAKLVRFVRDRLETQALRHGGDPGALYEAQRALDEHTLTIGFARRFATYKRAALVLKDAARLARILGDKDRPVQIVFAGKAHPADKDGQAVLQRVVRAAQSKRFRGRIVVLEEYDMQVGRMMTAGCDVWLNTPLRPNEASGTSGMKPPLHGGINCSISDGWWPEGYNGKNGFVIGGKQFNRRADQDRHDAASLYDLLERKIVPMFYTRGKNGLPTRWLNMARQSMASIPGQFNTHRMLGEYTQNYYLPAHHG